MQLLRYTAGVGIFVLMTIMGVDPASSQEAATYPDDAYSRPCTDRWSAFETLCGVSIAGGNTLQRATAFHENEFVLETISKETWAHWTFRRKAGINTGTVLGFFETLRRMPEDIQFTARNDSGKPVNYAIVVSEMAWSPGKEANTRDWLIWADKPLQPGATELLTFSFAKARDIKNPEQAGTMRFPARIGLHIPETVEETKYDLRLKELTVHYRPVKLEKAGLSASETANVKETVPFFLLASGLAASQDICIELRAGTAIWWRIRLTDAERSALPREDGLILERAIPWYLPEGEYVAGLTVDGYRCTEAETAIRIKNPIEPKLPKMERRLHQGRPTVFINDLPFMWSGYASYDFQPGNVNEFGASGANMMVIATDAGRHVHQVAAPTWTTPDTHDYSELGERVGMALQANPDAYLTLRVALSLPPFWLQQHPESRALVRTDQGDLTWEETGTVACSLASGEWRAQQEQELRLLIRHCMKQPWASRLAGFMIMGEVTEEWFAWGCNDGFYADYSKVNENAFGEWCKAKSYPWTRIPDPAARKKPGQDLYAEDDAGRASAAYAQYCSDKTAETIAHFARVVKEETDGRSLTGVFYGYVIQLAGEPRQHLSGHFALRRLCDDSNLDFFSGIPLHNFRSLGDGYDTYVSATESILAAGKLFLNENDLFSWLHNLTWYTEYDTENPRGGAITMHQRVLANDMIHGTMRQWFSLLASWHHDAGLQKEFRRAIELNNTAIQYDRSPVEEIAFVVDDTSFAWMPPESSLSRETNADLMRTFARTGAPLGVWLLSDLDRLPERIRMVVVASATAAHAEDITRLKALIERGGKTIVVAGPVGLVDPATQKWDPQAPAAITGLDVKADTTSGSGKGLILERPLSANGRLVWIGAPITDSGLARQWVETAGVHCYAPTGNTVYASRDLVSVTATTGGNLLIAWPESVAVKDLLTDWTASGKQMDCAFVTGQTRLFHVQRK